MMAEHLSEISAVMNIDISELSTLIDDVLNDPVFMLSEELQCELLYPDEFRKAVRRGLLKVKRGRVILGSFPTVFYAYLFGRLFADDYSDSVCGRAMWGRGGEKFPAAELQRYFHVGNLKQTRGNCIGVRVPDKYQMVDSLFV